MLTKRKTIGSSYINNNDTDPRFNLHILEVSFMDTGSTAFTNKQVYSLAE